MPHRTRRIVFSIVGAIGALLVGAVLFIKFDTTAAANFTDNYLRPILGDTIVIGLEKAYFNAADKARQIGGNDPSAPQFIGRSNTTAGLSGGRLDTRPIAVNQGFKPLPGEGVWRDKPLALFPGQSVAAYTFWRPDPGRDYAIVRILQVDMTKVRMGSVAGTKQPGGPVGKPGPGVIPQNIIDSGTLVAAFDGGFMYRDGAYGMIVGDTTYLPLKKELGTLVGYKDGSLRILDYAGQSLGKNVAFVRQNCPILIGDGTMSVLDEKNKALWGRTPTTAIFTWRSGIGLTKNGDLLFAVGNNLTPATLAVALQAAGAVNAIQLDINPVWVRFNFFEYAGHGQYTSSTLTRDLKDGAQQYLHGYTKDFFYLYKK